MKKPECVFWRLKICIQINWHFLQTHLVLSQRQSCFDYFKVLALVWSSSKALLSWERWNTGIEGVQQVQMLSGRTHKTLEHWNKCVFGVGWKWSQCQQNIHSTKKMPYRPWLQEGPWRWPYECKHFKVVKITLLLWQHLVCLQKMPVNLKTLIWVI